MTAENVTDTTDRNMTMKDAQKATERRLHAMPIIKLKIESDKERLEELEAGLSVPMRSMSMVRFSGRRIPQEDIREALIRETMVRIAIDEYEVSTMEKALSIISGDPYYDVVSFKYIQRMADDMIAEQIKCDQSTVRRNRGRLIRNLAIFLYGSVVI